MEYLASRPGYLPVSLSLSRAQSERRCEAVECRCDCSGFPAHCLSSFVSDIHMLTDPMSLSKPLHAKSNPPRWDDYCEENSNEHGAAGTGNRTCTRACLGACTSTHTDACTETCAGP